MGSDHGQRRRPFLRSRVRSDRRFRVELEQARVYGVPHSIFTGRPTPAPGEQLFTAEDTAAAVALAEEEADTCPSCGLPKAWCRDPAAQFGWFEAREEQCHATYALAAHRNGTDYGKKDDLQRAATQMSVRFAEGKAPDVEAGLGLTPDGSGGEEHAEDR